MGLCKVESRIAAVERERRNVITPQTCFIGMLSIIFCRQRTSSSAIIKDASSRALYITSIPACLRTVRQERDVLSFAIPRPPSIFSSSKVSISSAEVKQETETGDNAALQFSSANTSQASCCSLALPSFPSSSKRQLLARVYAVSML